MNNRNYQNITRLIKSESPFLPYIWLWFSFIEVLRNKDAYIQHVGCCFYGAPWRTWLWRDLCSLEDILLPKARLCSSSSLDLFYSKPGFSYFSIICIISIFYSQYYVYELKDIWEAKVKLNINLGKTQVFFLPTYDAAVRYKRKGLIPSHQEAPGTKLGPQWPPFVDYTCHFTF